MQIASNRQRILEALKYFHGRASLRSVISESGIRDNVLKFRGCREYRYSFTASREIQSLVDEGVLKKVRTRWGYSLILLPRPT